MKELTEIVQAWEAFCAEKTVRAEDREAILATVVAVSGSTYRRPGARMLLTAEGRLAGSVSGGCLEGDLLRKAAWHTRSGPVLVTYDSTDEDDVVWGFGLGCNGRVQVLLERISQQSPGPLKLLENVLHQRHPAVIATLIGEDTPESVGQRLLLMSDGATKSTISCARLEEQVELEGQVERDAAAVLAARKSCTQTYLLPHDKTAAVVFLEVILPPLPLVIFGANHDALPLIRFAKELGWHVTVVDTRAALPRPERFPLADSVLAGSLELIGETISLSSQTVAVVMTHNYPDDKQVLRLLLTSPVSYIGQLGPWVRTERLLAEIRDDGLFITDAHRSCLHSPVGLDLGADTPEQIALSITAEIQAGQAGRAGGFLRDRSEPMHIREKQTSCPLSA